MRKVSLVPVFCLLLTSLSLWDASNGISGLISRKEVFYLCNAKSSIKAPFVPVG